jgi:hypothetical protein
LTTLPRFLLATLLAALSWLLARLLLSAAAFLAALAALLAALILLAWLLFSRVHNCSFVSSLPTTKPRPLSFLRTLVRKRTIRPVAGELKRVSKRLSQKRRVFAPCCVLTISPKI